MSYYFTKKLDCSFEEAIDRTTKALADCGFGILSEINVHEKFKEKLDKDFRRYRILGACNPANAYQALQHEDKIGTMLPCNVVVQEHAPNRIEVTAVDPVASMQAVQNDDLAGVAREVRDMLKKSIEAI